VTEAPRVPALAFADLDEAVSALRERGLRISTPRRLVLEALFTADRPVSAESLSTTLGLDLASVYRNLETLEAHGVVRHVHLGHGPGLHALAGPGEREYLYCESCGDVRAVDPSELDPVRDRIRELHGLEARFTHFPIAGLCEQCATGSSAHDAQ
jgi:Fur family ferric uptake transcriptional regulator